MHSPADSIVEPAGPRGAARAVQARTLFENIARAVGVCCLLLAIWLSLRGAEAVSPPGAQRVEGTSADQLARAAAEPFVSALAVSATQMLDAEARAVLHAARLSGLRVSVGPALTAAAFAATAVSADARRDPAGGMLVQLLAPQGSSAVLSDTLGWIDSVEVAVRSADSVQVAGRNGAAVDTLLRRLGAVRWTVDGHPRTVQLSAANTELRVAAPALPELGRIRVFGAPGWESRFVVQALEEAGWVVDASFTIAPRVQITSGSPAALDTARYAAVIALDSSAWAQSAAIARYVQSGGGLVLLAEAARAPAFAALRAGTVGVRLPGIPGALKSDAPREGLPLRAILSLKRNAVVVERDFRQAGAAAGTASTRALVSVAQRRVGGGRVAQVGYADSWEWRMLGDDLSPERFQDFWRALVASVAYVPYTEERAARSRYPGNSAPLADLRARLWDGTDNADSARINGEDAKLTADSSGTATSRVSPSAPPRWLFMLAVISLLTEWWSRRLRGAR